MPSNNCKKNISTKAENNFRIGVYGDIEIALDGHGFINCSKILRDMNSDKKFHAWVRGKFIKALMKKMVKSLNISVNDLIITYNDCSNNFKGSYCHPDLIPHFLSWISPKY